MITDINDKYKNQLKKEFQASAIPDRLRDANVQVVSGLAVVWELTKFAADGKESREVQRLEERYAFAADGGWIAYGEQIDGAERIAYFKPFVPRKGKDGKEIKYETPLKAEAAPIVPVVDEESGKDIFERFGIEWDGTNFWSVFRKHPDVPIFVTEGLKKALAIIGQGFPAIALRGIANWRSRDGQLHPVLEAVTAGRRVYIAFDSDEKITSVKNVQQQALKLGLAISAKGSTVQIASWDSSQGKGIDDALAALPAQERRRWMEAIMENAHDLSRQRKETVKASAALVLHQRQQMSDHVSNGHISTGRYMPQPLRPYTPHIVAIQAPMGVGKTTNIVAMAKDWIANGGKVLWLTPVNSLGKQAATLAGLPHIHDLDEFHADRMVRHLYYGPKILEAGGLVCCINSIERAMRYLTDEKLLLVLDEATQLLTDGLQGGTTKHRWATVTNGFVQAVKQAAATGYIIASQAELDAPTVTLLQKLSGLPVSFYKHLPDGLPSWIVNRTDSPEHFAYQLLEKLRDKKNVMLVTTSQLAAKRFELLAWKQGVFNTIRIDSETNQKRQFDGFFENPDGWLQRKRPQLLILTPSAKSGISIEGGVPVESAYFDSVFGFFTALDTDTQMQMLGRYRPAVPRFVYTSPIMLLNADEKPRKGFIRAHFHFIETMFVNGLNVPRREKSEVAQAIEGFIVAQKERTWAQKIQAEAALTKALTTAGHTVVEQIPEVDDQLKAIRDCMKEVKLNIAQLDAEKLAALDIPDRCKDNPRWIKAVRTSPTSTYEDRLRALKVQMQMQLPLLDWNDPETWLHLYFDPKSGKKRLAGARLFARSFNSEAVWKEEAQDIHELLTANIPAVHLLPTYLLEIELAKLFMPAVRKIIAKGRVAIDCPDCVQLRDVALKNATAVAHCWNLQIKDSYSITAVCNKILRRFGVQTTRDKCLSYPSGQKAWTYRLSVDEWWLNAVEAQLTGLKLDSDVINSILTPLRPLVPPPSPPPPTHPSNPPPS